jgi:hypothetical protein
METNNNNNYNYNYDLKDFSKEMNKSLNELYMISYIILGILCFFSLLWLSTVFYLIHLNRKKELENLKVKLLLKNGEPIRLSDLKIKD